MVYPGNIVPEINDQNYETSLHQAGAFQPSFDPYADVSVDAADQ